MIRFWVAPTLKQDAITRTLGQTLKGFRPDVPKHSFEVVNDDPLLPAPGELVMVCGARGLDVLKAGGIVPKHRTLNSLREKPLARPGGGHWFTTFDPSIVANEPEKRAIIDWDVRLAHRFMTTGSLQPVLGDYRWVGSFQPMIDRIKLKHVATGQPVDVACDTETMGLYPYEPGKELVSIAFSDQAGTAEVLYLGPKADPVPVDPNEPLGAQIEWLLTSPLVKIRGANFKYDLVWIAEKLGIECTNFRFDTALTGSLVDENRSNGLDSHAKAMSRIGGYADPFNATYDKDKMEEVPLDALLPYAGGDVDAVMQIADVLKEELLEDGELARFYVKVLHPAARAFERIERRGVVVDREKYEKLSDDLAVEIKQNEQLAMSLLPGRMKAKYHDKIAEQVSRGKSPLTPAIMKDFFFGPIGLGLKPKMVTEKTGEPSTARAHLRMFAEVPEAMAMCDALEALNSAGKTKSTFVDGFLKHLRADGRLHPTYMLFHGGFNDDEDDESGTVSGRLSAKDPPIQVTPKKTKHAKRIRECFTAPPGFSVLQVDYVQGELKVVACIAPEPTMLNAYQQGLDLHAVTGAQLIKMPFEQFLAMKECGEVSKEALFASTRDRAKPANFGLLYGLSAEGFQAYAWAAYGIALTLAEAEDMRDAFFKLYPGLINYHQAMRNFVRQWLHVRTPMGRVRHLETIRSWDRVVRSRAERQAINSPVQGALTDMMIWACAEIEANLPTADVQVAAVIHDALIAYVRQGKELFYAKQITDIMQSLPLGELGWVPQLVFNGEAEAGPDLAHLKKLKLAA